MPNHVTNKLTFKGKPGEIQTLRETILSVELDKTNIIDFNRIIPMPASLMITAGSATDYGIAVILFREENNPSLLLPVMEYPWAKSEGIKTPKDMADHLVEQKMANLIDGKKALENKKLYGYQDWYSWACANWGTKWNSYSHESDGPNEIKFDTAWSAPFPIIEKLSEMFPEIQITLEYADEDFGQNCGVVIFKAGDVVEENIPEGGSVEAIVLASRVKGMGLDCIIDYYGEQDDEEWVGKLIASLLFSNKYQDVVDSALSNNNVSATFLSVLKKELMDLEAYEVIKQVDVKLKEKETEGEEI